MVRKTSTYALAIPSLNTQVIKAQTMRRIESLLREGLETIEEGVEAQTPTPTPKQTPKQTTTTPRLAARALAEAAAEGAQIERRMSLHKRSVSARLQRSGSRFGPRVGPEPASAARSGPRPGRPGRRRWQLRISRFSTVMSAPFSSLGNSYVRMMNGFAHRHGAAATEPTYTEPSLAEPGHPT